MSDVSGFVRRNPYTGSALVSVNFLSPEWVATADQWVDGSVEVDEKSRTVSLHLTLGEPTPCRHDWYYAVDGERTCRGCKVSQQVV